MEQGQQQHHEAAPALMRRKRKVARQQREKTPEASKTGRKLSDEETSSTTTIEIPEAQNVQMQLRPPGSISSVLLLTRSTTQNPTARIQNSKTGQWTSESHKSKILSRRNKSFTGTAARSTSTPRAAENNNGKETYDFLRVARRSLSSPRHKEESSESGRSSPHLPQPIQSLPRTHASQLESSVKHPIQDDDSRSRLEQNLRRFEEERRRFELEKKKFEREKRELKKLRYKHLDPGDRHRMAETYRRLSDRIHLPSDSDEKQILIDKFLESQHLSVMAPKQGSRRASIEEELETPPPPIIENMGDYESSTATMSDSDIEAIDVNATDATDADDEEYHQAIKVREKRNHSRSSSISIRNRFAKNAPEIESLPELELIEYKNGKDKPPRPGFFSRIFSIFTIKKKPKKPRKPVVPPPSEELKPEDLAKQSLFKTTMRLVFVESRQEWKQLKAQYPVEVDRIRIQCNTCLCHLILLIMFCGFGGLMFRFIEGAFENLYKCGVRRVKRDFIDYLWQTSHNLREEDWKSSARMKLRKFEEELHTAHEAGMTSYSGMKSWNFVNSVLYCLTIVTTIGYGHITPTTVMGRSISIIYAIIGIPIFLILLADFGKLFTRGIKFLWAFVRRVYYTGSCRTIRKQQHVQQMMQGMNIVYEIAMRRPTLAFGGDPEKGNESNAPESPQSQHPQGSTAETPTSAHPETYLIDDEFNLPISVAITVLLLYIFIGAFVYCIWEDWTYFESFYFVFISMSTIGFGDYVPQHPIFMMASIAYLMFGLALTSMCINVVQVKLSDSFRQASAKIGATIGLAMSEEEVMNSQNQTPVELASVHSSPKLDRQITILDHNSQNNFNASPPPVPRRSPSKTDTTDYQDTSNKNKK